MFGAEGLSYRHGRGRRSTLALDQVAIEPRAGVIALLGPNGAGKTTLVRLAATTLPMQEGHIQFGNDRLGPGADPETLRMVRQRTGFCPQSVPVLDHFTCLEYLLYLGWLAGLDRPGIDARVEDVLAQVGLSDRANVRCGDLSGGMRRRLGIAQSLLNEPDVLLLDEPTAGLDPDERVRFRTLVERLRGVSTVVISTHQLEDVVRLAQEVVVLQQGRVVFQGSVAELAGSDVPTTEALEVAYRRLQADVA